jgi:coproporphyrinogen III oxidase-like Fe-S oxidoreductase
MVRIVARRAVRGQVSPSQAVAPGGPGRILGTMPASGTVGSDGAAHPASPPVPLRDIRPDRFTELMSAELAGSPPRDLMLYVHIPFCSSKCLFCDFVADMTVPDLISGADVRGRYVAALCRQIREYGPRLTDLGYRARLVYWGGGTPTRLSASELTTITAALAEAVDLGEVAEYSVESSPETVTVEKVRALRRAGVTRISTGVQSFVDSELRRAGRSHSAEQAVEAARAVRAGGIDNFNIDLIAGFPAQNLDGMRHSLDRCVALRPEHVTVYPYRADPRTVMARQIGRGDQAGPSYALLFDALALARELLTAAGYAEYAVGHFALEGRRFLGESYYFDLAGDNAGHFFGFGAGAGSTVGHHALANSHRTFRRFQDDPLLLETGERYSPHNLGILGKSLRLALLNWSGIDAQRFADIFGFPLATLREVPVFRQYLDYFRALGAEIVEDEQGLRVTPETQAAAHLRSYLGSEEYVYLPLGAPGPAGPRAPGRLT